MPRKASGTGRTAPKLTVLPQTKPELPKSSIPLGPMGLSLWKDLIGTYEFGDRASLEALAQACAAADRAEQCRQQIESDGELIRTKTGQLREHPLLRAEMANRTFCVRCLQRLGLDLEPTSSRGPGRPPGPPLPRSTRAPGYEW